MAYEKLKEDLEQLKKTIKMLLLRSDSGQNRTLLDIHSDLNKINDIDYISELNFENMQKETKTEERKSMEIPDDLTEKY